MPPKKQADDGTIAENRRARHDYAFEDTLEVGIELVGAEVKSLRAKSMSFADAFAMVDHGQLFLHGMRIDRWKNDSTHVELAVDRKRRLLASADEIEKLKKALQQRGLSLIPLKLYFKGPWAKVLLGIGKGKTYEDKRETLKKREADRDIERAMRRRS